MIAASAWRGICAALLSAGAALASWPATAQPVSGLIVRLKQAPAHVLLEARADRRTLEASRWQGVLASAMLDGTSGRAAPQRRAVGRDQFLLDFGRPLSAGELRSLGERLQQRPEGDWVEANVRERRQSVPNDPRFASEQWWLQPAGGSNANALADRRRGLPNFQRAWASGLPGATGVADPATRVAVLDTGITAHPDLSGGLLPGYDFVSDPVYANDGDGRDADPGDPGDWVAAEDLLNPKFADCAVEDSSWHGTFIAGMLAANTDNGVGVAAMNWQGRVLPVRVAGKCGATVSDIVDGMRWAAGLPVTGVPINPNPVRIVNISFGGTAACGQAYQLAVDELRAVGAVVVAAAGNETVEPTRPANCRGVVGVVALNRDGFKTTYSNFGSALGATGIATVGGDDRDGRWGGLLADEGLMTLGNLGRDRPGPAGYFHLFGTSFAAPVVSGALSLMLGINPGLSVDRLIQGLQLSARPHVVSAVVGACAAANPGRCICSTDTCGAGILDVERALQYALQPDTYVPPPLSPENIDADDVLQAAALGLDRGAGEPPVDGGSSGGGAFGPCWLFALATAIPALRRTGRLKDKVAGCGRGSDRPSPSASPAARR